MAGQRRVPEARVLLIMTGGTICMEQSPDGLIPARGFLDRCMAPRPEFNDGIPQDQIPVRYKDSEPAEDTKCLRTPKSKYGKTIRYEVKVYRLLGDSES